MGDILIGGSSDQNYYFGTTNGVKIGSSGNMVIPGALSAGAITSSGTFSAPAVTSTGTITGLYFSSTGYIKGPLASDIQTVSSSTTILTSYGVTILEGIAARSYTTCQAPVEGVHKWIHTKSSSEIVSIDLTHPILFSTATATDTPHIITFTTGPSASCVHLVGVDATHWAILGSRGAGLTLSS